MADDERREIIQEILNNNQAELDNANISGINSSNLEERIVGVRDDYGVDNGYTYNTDEVDQENEEDFDHMNQL